MLQMDFAILADATGLGSFMIVTLPGNIHASLKRAPATFVLPWPSIK
jgi:hypothetical protein